MSSPQDNLVRLTIADILRMSALPRHDARLLMGYVLGKDHAYLLAHGDRVPEDAVIAAFKQAEQRRLQGEPLAYITGVKEFYGREFSVSPEVLVPRPETELLLELALARLPERGRLWDIGTGSGVLAVTAACERADAEVTASDISAAALLVAKKNAAALSAGIRFYAGSWFAVQPPPGENYYDVILSNPPYIRADDEHLQGDGLRFEPVSALTDFGDGLEPIRLLTAGAGHFLKAGGSLLVEHGYDQGATVRELFAAGGFSDVRSDTDLAGWERVTSGYRY